MADALLTSLKLPEFSPAPTIKNGVLQTITGAYIPQLPELKAVSFHEIPLADGDRLVAVENRPQKWKNLGPIALLVHGLTGSSDSNYMVRLARKLALLGVRVIRLNLRNCGPGYGKSRHIPHAGRSEDIRQCLHWIQDRYPGSPVALFGFSMGANMSIKLCGEPNLPANLHYLIAVSSPLDLYLCAQTIHPAFDKYFTMNLRKHTREIERKIYNNKIQFPDKLKTIFDFDDFYTAPKSGYIDAKDYYEDVSSLRFVKKITVPSLFLCAKDDPVCNPQPYSNLQKKSYLDLVLPEHGGHIGFIGNGQGMLNLRWMDDLVLRWLQKNSPNFFIRKIF